MFNLRRTCEENEMLSKIDMSQYKYANVEGVTLKTSTAILWLVIYISIMAILVTIFEIIKPSITDM